MAQENNSSAIVGNSMFRPEFGQDVFMQPSSCFFEEAMLGFIFREWEK